MDFSLPPSAEEYRNEIRRIAAEVVTPEIVDRQHRTGTFNSPELNKALADAGFI